MPGRFLVMRHADVYDSPRGEKVLYGNVPGFWLSHLGIRQARASGLFLADHCDLDVVVHSPMERTEQTARIVVDRHPTNPSFEVMDEIRDIGVGPWEGRLSRREWTDHRHRYWEEQMRGGVKGLEHPTEIQQRMVDGFQKVLEKYQDKNVLMVSHGDPICFLFQHYLNEPLEPLISYHLGVNKAAVFEIKPFDPVSVTKLFEPYEYGTVYPRPHSDQD